MPKKKTKKQTRGAPAVGKKRKSGFPRTLKRKTGREFEALESGGSMERENISNADQTPCLAVRSFQDQSGSCQHQLSPDEPQSHCPSSARVMRTELVTKCTDERSEDDSEWLDTEDEEIF